VEATAQRQLLQLPDITGTITAMGSNTSSNDSSSTNSSREVIKVCPAWATEAATAGGALQVGNGSNASIVSFSADFNQAEHGGVTAADRQAALAAAAAAAAAAAEAAGSPLLSPGSNATQTQPPPVAFAPGLFDPLTVDEMLAGEATDMRSSSTCCGCLQGTCSLRCRFALGSSTCVAASVRAAGGRALL
jgi:hypothetical protein